MPRKKQEVEPTLTKSERIRQILGENPNAMPEATAAQMRKEGYKTCTAGFVSTVKSQERKRLANGDAPPPPRAGAPSVAKRSRKAIVQISIDGLKAAKSLIDELGSPEKAHEVLDNLERIGGIARARATLDALEALK